MYSGSQRNSIKHFVRYLRKAFDSDFVQSVKFFFFCFFITHLINLVYIILFDWPKK